MRNLKRLVVTLCLISVLAITALAGEIQTPPCASPDPGEIQTPPCSPAQLTTEDPTNPGETETPPAAETVVINSIVDAAVGAFLSVW
jgi:hypothetical protein